MAEEAKVPEAVPTSEGDENAETKSNEPAPEATTASEAPKESDGVEGNAEVKVAEQSGEAVESNDAEVVKEEQHEDVVKDDIQEEDVENAVDEDIDTKAEAEDETKPDEKEEEKANEEEDAEETEEAQKKMAEKFDPNQIPQVNVSTLGQRQWQIKVYPLRPSDFASGDIGRVFKQAKESLLYVYTAGANGEFSNGKAELYMSTIGQAARAMTHLMKMSFYHPETNIKIIRKNDAGVVLEKAYMRFDTKMTSLLFRPVNPNRRGVGNKRERIIGSVFLKNLPDGATKDMMRVMFPFAGEVNFNPEKFKDSTARLVMSNRGSVIPCLKAFSKVELGGNILELRPLEKRNPLEDGPIENPPKSESKSSSSSKDTPKTPAKPAPKKEASKDSAKKPSAAGDAPGAKGSKTSSSASKKIEPKRGAFRGRGASAARSRGGAISRKFENGKFSSQRWSDRASAFKAGRGGRGRASTFGGSNKGRFASSPRAATYRNAGSPGRSSGMGIAESMSGEVTREMMNLQTQLSVAIKNQLSMLNQTQMAVEQAKRGAAASTAAAVAQAMGGSSGSLAALSRGMSSSSSEQYSRASGTARRAETPPRRREIERSRDRPRRGGAVSPRGSVRTNIGRQSIESRQERGGNFLGKRRAAFDDDSYEDITYNSKRPSFGMAAAAAASLAGRMSSPQSSQRIGRNWAEESEHLDPTYGNRAGASYRDDYDDNAGFSSNIRDRSWGTASTRPRAFGSGAYSRGSGAGYFD